MQDLTIIISFYIITKTLSLLLDEKSDSWAVTIFAYITIFVSLAAIIGTIINL